MSGSIRDALEGVADSFAGAVILDVELELEERRGHAWTLAELAEFRDGCTRRAHASAERYRVEPETARAVVATVLRLVRLELPGHELVSLAELEARLVRNGGR